MILGMAALSLSLLVGGAGLVSLGHAAMVGVGAYAVAALDAAGITGARLVFPAAILAAGLFALLTGAVSLRTSGVHFIMITLAFGQMAFFTAASLSVPGRRRRLHAVCPHHVVRHPAAAEPPGVPLRLPRTCWPPSGCCARSCSTAASAGCCARRGKTRCGSQALGFSPYPYRLVAYVLAGGISGLAGALLANATEFVSPATLSWDRSGELLFMVILGGAGHLYGAIIGALAIVLLEEWLSHLLRLLAADLRPAAGAVGAVPARRPGRRLRPCGRGGARRCLSRCWNCAA